MSTGHIDSSGIRITYTPTLRTYDSGTFEVGMVQGIAVPPGDNGFAVHSYCLGDCTGQVMFSRRKLK